MCDVATCVPILVSLDLSVLELFPMYVTDVRQKHRFMLPPRGQWHNKDTTVDRTWFRCLF